MQRYFDFQTTTGTGLAGVARVFTVTALSFSLAVGFVAADLAVNEPRLRAFSAGGLA